jgi:hypothetical protein
MTAPTVDQPAYSRRFPLTDMPVWLMAALVAVGIPRTVLADLDVVPANSGLPYYVLALTPYACWLAVAVLRPTRKPVMDFVVLGVLYGISLIVVHQVLWGAEGHIIPQSAHDFAEQFRPSLRELVLRVYSSGIALAIGAGSGLVGSAVAFTASRIRSGAE